MAEENLVQHMIEHLEEENDRALRRADRFQVRRPVESLFDVPDDLFQANYRLNKELALGLCEDLRGALPVQNRRSALSVEARVLTALSFYATGSYQRLVGAAAAMSQRSASRCIVGVTEAINNLLLDRWINFPMTDQERSLVKRGFMEKFNFPGVMGAIDGTHVSIIAPHEGNRDFPEHFYVNRKGYHSINVQLVCDSDLRILSCIARYPGSTHDAFIFKHSILRDWIQTQHAGGNLQNTWLLGDSGYALEPWMITPIPDPAPQTPADRFNRCQSRARNTIERVNGVLKSRFRCLLRHRCLHYSPTTASKIITACVVLHNMCTQHNLAIRAVHDEEEDEEEEEVNGEFRPIPVDGENDREAATLAEQGRRIQQQLIRYMN